VRLLLRPPLESERKIARITAPTLIVHGRRDVAIPFAMADRLAAAAGGPVTRVSLADANHNDLFDLGADEILETLRRFLEGLPPAPAPQAGAPRPGG
jgi:fermentation-respiration switch protein FrsA (DUF1100 family)